MPRSSPTPAWKIAVWSVPVIGVLVVAVGGLRTGYSLKSVLMWGVVGMALGGLVVPEYEPRSVRFPALWQMGCGLVAGVLIPVMFGAGGTGIFAGAVLGIALGFLAPYWLSRFNI